MTREFFEAERLVPVAANPKVTKIVLKDGIKGGEEYNSFETFSTPLGQLRWAYSAGAKIFFFQVNGRPPAELGFL